MDNPFLNKSGRTEYVTSTCSVNRIRLAKLPIYGVDDSIEGLSVQEFFNVKLVIAEIKANAEGLHIDVESTDEKALPKLLAEKAVDISDSSGSELAKNIMKKFGRRLGMFLLALKLSEKENRAARSDWNDEHWEYWQQLDDVILVGGLASGIFGDTMKECVKEVFARAGVKPYNVLTYDNSQHVAVLGCASCIKQQDGVFVVMDLGQTNMKRSFVVKSGGEVIKLEKLETFPSKYMEWNIPDKAEERRQAAELHRYIVSAAEQAYREAESMTGCEPGGEIVISVASYVVNGKLNDNRSGYAKLCILGDNYAECLGYELSGRLRRNISVKLVHDGTAVALNFRSKKNTVCLSVGSYFGVGFPETKVDG